MLKGMKINLIMTWAWILAGFLSGMVMGLFFHKETWLGGYASHKRRLYRLGHISFFGLAIMNFIFYLTFRGVAEPGALVRLASWTFVVGAVTMPVCCAAMAHWPKSHMIFSVPVVSLIAGAVITLVTIIRL